MVKVICYTKCRVTVLLYLIFYPCVHCISFVINSEQSLNEIHR